MKFSQLLATTLRKTSADTEVVSHDLLLRAGYIRQLSAGIFSYLHLGWRSLRKIEQILREEMDAIGGVELNMPVVHPAEIWHRTGRYDLIDESLLRFTDRTKRSMVLAMTHEEVVGTLAASEITSYKQLPKLIYQMQTKYRDEARARGGLIRVKEFVMKDSYSLDTSWEGLEKQYHAHYYAYYKIFMRAGLPVIAIKSDTGMMGGSIAHEYMYLTDIGEDTIFLCEKTGYKANKEVAVFKKHYPNITPKALEKVYTPQQKTIADLADFLGVCPDECAKMVFFMGEIADEEEEKLIAVVVRGDMEVNPVKVQKLAKAVRMRTATEDEIAAAGGVAGFASPIGLDDCMSIVVVDDLVAHSNNLVTGANESEYHYLNSCYGRDYTAQIVGDVAMAYEGAPAPNTDDDDAVLTAVRGVEVGNIFQLGTKYSEALDATFMGENGRPQPIVMGSYGIGVGRMLACLAEEHHDENGLKLPPQVAPYHVHIVGLLDKANVKEQADMLYHLLKNAGIEVLYDDRHKKMASPGIKFSDADLIGLPIRLTISSRSLKNGGVELKRRDNGESKMVELEEVLLEIRKLLGEMTIG